jgi:methylated-DNA-[protein]-cysteine S-methyltransferase
VACISLTSVAAQPHPGRRRAGGVIDHAAFQLDAHFAGDRTVFDLPLVTAGSPVQERVWARLRSVPYAATITYGQIAADLGLAPGVARVVGSANARNPLSIIVPCHRVIGASGSLIGYGGGVIAKRYLLNHEARTVGAILGA